MTESKHTPGPWFAHSDGTVREGIERAGYSPGIKLGSTWVEDAFCGDDATEESRANARLIAAAPDLLEVLEKLNSLANDGEPIQSWNAIWGKVEAVLKKAKGEVAP